MKALNIVISNTILMLISLIIFIVLAILEKSYCWYFLIIMFILYGFTAAIIEIDNIKED